MAGTVNLRVASPAGRWVLVATVLGSGMAVLDSTVVNVALPAIGRTFNAPVSGLQWVLTSYLVTLSALILIGGSLGDIFGRRRVFLVGVAWFSAASLLCALTPTLSVLIAARALQGVGGALLVPGSLSIIQASFVPDDRGEAIGLWSGLGGVASAVGPLAGGFLVTAVSWRLIFLLNLPLALMVALAARHVPETRDPTANRQVDVLGAALAVVGLAGATYALTEGPSGSGSLVVLVCGIVGAGALVGFVVTEASSRHPMLPLVVFRSRQFTVSNLLTFVVYGALGVVIFLLAIDLQEVLGYSAFAAGAALLPITVLMLLLSAKSGELSQRIGPRLQMTVGPLVIAAGLLLMLRVRPDAGYLAAVLPAVVVFGLGLVVTVAPLTTTVLAAVDTSHSGVASGVNNAVARVAGLLAVAVIPPLVGLTGAAYRDPVTFSSGFHQALVIAAVMCAAGAAMAGLGIVNPRRDGGEAPVREARSCPFDAPALRPRRTNTPS